MSIIIAPTINLNGSNPDVLLRHLENAVRGAHLMRDALLATAPHSRDYPGRDEAYTIAREQHFNRLAAVTEIEDAMMEIAAAIISQRN